MNIIMMMMMMMMIIIVVGIQVAESRTAFQEEEWPRTGLGGLQAFICPKSG